METPDYIFESSWEVCNKVGGIYTVLSTKALTLQRLYPDRIIFIGPDIRKEEKESVFICDETLFPEWRSHAQSVERLKVKTGRWDVPGKPPVILVDFTPFFKERDKLFYHIWERFNVDSLAGGGDYDEPCLFACAAGRIIESFYRYYRLHDKRVVAAFNEWMLGMGALYIKANVPGIAVLFTTHATSVGRSIASNNKPLYSQLEAYDGDLMAKELHIAAKHSVEKQAAGVADCFTAVSDLTALECKQLLGKAPDVVTPNGFEPDFVPQGEAYARKRATARHALINVAGKLLGCAVSGDALLVATGGRYEYRNKGIDLFIDAMDKLRTSGRLARETVAFIMVPAGAPAARADLQAIIRQDRRTGKPLQFPFATHWLHNMEEDAILNYIRQKGFTNEAGEKLKIIFIPCYLNGCDGIFNLPYYDLLMGMDATVYPSRYEPWGYTPLESVAFGIPTVTTSLAGFGLWARKETGGKGITQGVCVVERTDNNYFEAAEAIAQAILSLSVKGEAELSAIRNNCRRLASKARWSRFIVRYQEAYRIALQKAR
ncbi:MAG: glycosyl transferase [Bacteroidales bacterium]